MKVFLTHYNSKNNGTPNAPVRVLIAFMVLKEAEGLSSQKIFENCHFNMMTSRAIGLLNADDSVPAESTCHLFRKHINEYAKTENENLFDVIFGKYPLKSLLYELYFAFKSFLTAILPYHLLHSENTKFSIG